METRSLGRTGVQVSPLCLGAMMFGAWGNTDHDDCIRIIHRALDAGINFIDTADVYARGESEEIVGKALAGGRRDDVVLATKVHGTMGDDPNEFGNSRRWIIREVENSLRRLGTDWIDLYQIHRPEPDTDIDETLGALTDLVRAGKVRYIGTSTFPASQIVEAQWVARERGRERFVCEQPPYSILVRGIEADVLPTCQRYGMGVIPWSPLAGGWLSGRYRQGAELPAVPPRGADPEPLRHVAAREPAQARGRRALARARRRGGDDADRAGDRVRDPPSGRDRGDHRPAHDGAPRVPARPRPTSCCPTTCSTASTRSCRPGSTSTRPTAAGSTRRWSRRRGGGRRWCCFDREGGARPSGQGKGAWEGWWMGALHRLSRRARPGPRRHSDPRIALARTGPAKTEPISLRSAVFWGRATGSRRALDCRGVVVDVTEKYGGFRRPPPQ